MVLQDFLTPVKQGVVLNDLDSFHKSGKASVFQGSIVDLLLFLIYMNDQLNALTNPKLFVDDILLCTL